MIAADSLILREEKNRRTFGLVTFNT